MKIYLIGSLRDANVPKVAKQLREAGHEVFDDWYAAGPEADDYWQRYEQERGHSYPEALEGYAANHVFHYDHKHLDRCEGAVLVMPCGRSGHLELGYMLGQGKPGWVLLPKEPERWDVMYRFATGVHFTVADVLSAIKDKESNMFPTFWIPAPELGPREGYSYQYKYAQNGT
jgi:nucleoside 2-deoxyribosyltransferase